MTATNVRAIVWNPRMNVYVLEARTGDFEGRVLLSPAQLDMLAASIRDAKASMSLEQRRLNDDNARILAHFRIPALT